MNTPESRSNAPDEEGDAEDIDGLSEDDPNYQERGMTPERWSVWLANLDPTEMRTEVLAALRFQLVMTE